MMINLIHIEISVFTARCCFDYENPFCRYTPKTNLQEKRPIEEVLKFRPTVSAIYPACSIEWCTSSQLLRIIEFYQALDRWRNEIDTIRDLRQISVCLPDLVRLQHRLGETLKPALRALETFEEADFERDALLTLYSNANDFRAKLPLSRLREKLADLIKLAEAIRPESTAS